MSPQCARKTSVEGDNPCKMKRRITGAALLFILVFLCPFLTSLEARQLPAIPLPLGAHLNEQYTDDLDGLINRRYIRVLTTLNKTNFFIHRGKLFGFEYSLLKEYEKYLNRNVERRELRTVLEFIPVTRDRLITDLINGYGDISAAGLTITPQRERFVAFTNPYLTGVDELVVTYKNLPELKSNEELSGRSVLVRKSSSYYESLLALNKRLTKKNLEPVRIELADENLETEDILEIVNSGAISITVADSHLAGIWSKVLPNIRVCTRAKLRTGGKIAWMVRRQNPKLRASLNRFLARYRKGTLLGNIYFNRYYRKNPWIRNPLALRDSDKVKGYVRLFKKYARKYGFDWMLIMAMAYQESGLDPEKKNPSGAIGIMQIRPETARDRHVGISDVEDLENNIHAAVKYLAFLKKKYFTSSQIRPRDQVRFALAAYNSGPAKVAKARKLARKMGLNPNRWFRNVEVAALRVIGQETVRYVSNINKYYLIYRMAEATEKKRLRRKKKVEMN